MATKYPGSTTSGYNSSPPSDDGTVSDANKVKWSSVKTKLTDPLNTAIDDIDTKLQDWADVASIAKSSAYTTTADDDGRMIECTGTFNLTLGTAATMGSGYRVIVKNVSTGTITVKGTIDGATDDSLAQNESGIYVVNNGENAYYKASNKGVTPSSTDTLTNKTLTSPTINAPVINAVELNGAITGNAATTDLTSSAASDEFAFADAIKTYVDSMYSLDTTSNNMSVTLFGGLILKWGYDSSSGEVDIVFTTPFPNAIWSVHATDRDTSVSGGVDRAAAVEDSPSVTGFRITKTHPAYWFAIGN